MEFLKNCFWRRVDNLWRVNLAAGKRETDCGVERSEGSSRTIQQNESHFELKPNSSWQWSLCRYPEISSNGWNRNGWSDRSGPVTIRLTIERFEAIIQSLLTSVVREDLISLEIVDSPSIKTWLLCQSDSELSMSFWWEGEMISEHHAHICAQSRLDLRHYE
jgi:hypothetical protein